MARLTGTLVTKNETMSQLIYLLTRIFIHLTGCCTMYINSSTSLLVQKFLCAWPSAVDLIQQNILCLITDFCRIFYYFIEIGTGSKG